MSLSAVVVDDSVIYRKVVRDTLANFTDVEVVGIARDGDQAVEKIRRYKPDFVTLDFHLPKKNGLEVLSEIHNDDYRPKIFLISSAAVAGSQLIRKSFQLGVDACILKPEGECLQENTKALFTQLETHIDSARGNASSLASKPAAAGSFSQFAKPQSSAEHSAQQGSSLISESAPAFSNSTCATIDYGNTTKFQWNTISAIGIGISTGGPRALTELVAKMPSRINKPIFVVQHMPAGFTKNFAEHLNQQTHFTVVEAADKMQVQKDHLYVAPGGFQMKVVEAEGRTEIAITQDPPVRSCRPSVDYLFESLAKVYGSRTLGIIMTGMGDDGLDGCKALSKRGCPIWTQTEASSTVFGMPRVVRDANLSKWEFDVQELAHRLNQMIASHGGTR